MRRCLLIAAAVVVVSVPMSASAGPILVGSDDWVGSRTTPDPSGVVGAGGWDDSNAGFEIAWNIVDASSSDSGNWEYEYSFANADGSQPLDPELSHWLLEVSEAITPDNVDSVIFDTNFDPFEGPKSWSGEDPGNPNLPAEIHALKLDTAQTTYTFESTQAPVWGDFYAKDGKQGGVDVTAWNTEIGTDPDETTSDFTGWIPTPDTTTTTVDTTPVPEPSTLALAGIGMSCLMGSRLRRRRKTD